MGNSASAHLVYGFVLEEGDLPEKIDYFEVNDKWRDDFISEYPENGTEEEQDGWRKELSEYKESINFVEIGSGGYEFEQKYIGTSLNFYGDYEGEKVNIKKLGKIDTSPYAASIKKFCEDFGIEYKHPYWFLLANYG